MSGSRRGFTLIELAVVVAILLLLTGILIPVVRTELENAMQGKAQSDLKTVSDAFNRYYAHTGAWPARVDGAGAEFKAATAEGDLSGLRCLRENVFQRKRWNGPYLSEGFAAAADAAPVGEGGSSVLDSPTDPWGSPYRVYYFGQEGAMGKFGGIVLVSAGGDRAVSTTPEDIAAAKSAGDDLLQVVTRSL